MKWVTRGQILTRQVAMMITALSTIETMAILTENPVLKVC